MPGVTPLPRPVENVFAAIAARAPAADRGETTLAPDIEALRRAGVLQSVVAGTAPGGDALRAATLLRRIGRASLSVGRLVEGHANALKLVALYGRPRQRARIEAEVRAGAFLGVWGADAETPAAVAGQRLAGEKRFASGLGLVTRAVVTARDEAGGQLLLLVDATDPDRADASGWRTTGMRATLSGRFRLDDLPFEPLGQPGDYQREPHFEGGVWRYAALHAGGIEALAEAVRTHLAGRDADPHQAHRFAALLRHATTARLWVERSALAVEGPGTGANTGPAAVALALLGREAVEEAALAAIGLADRALGTAAFAEGQRAELVRRDLAFFLRQANLDGKLSAAAELLRASPLPPGEYW